MTEEQIVEALKALGARRIKRTKGWVMCSCPVAGKKHENSTDSRPSFGISIDSPSHYHCFTCHVKGLVWTIPMLLRTAGVPIERVNAFQAVVHKYEKFQCTGEKKETKKMLGLIPIFKLMNYDRPSSVYKSISLESYDIWDIRFANNTLIFPISDKLGRVVDIKLRDISGKGRGFYSPNEDSFPDLMRPEGSCSAKAGGVWYGMHFSLDRAKKLFLVEGERDAIMLKQVGITNVWASMGASITDTQLATIRDVGMPLVIFFDNDSAGIDAAKRIEHVCKRTSNIFKVANYFMCKDPAELVERKLINLAMATIRK